ncbi:MAG: hypothetical protein Crog4KO_21740 [Crocinitomicaceae bacterium]
MEGYKELLDKLNGLVKSLENGELSLDELTTLEEVTRKLHERSIILRYKAFETSVLGDVVETEETPVVETPVVATEPEPTPEPAAEELEEEEETAFDFAIFDEESEEEEASEMPEMDISSQEAAEEEVTPEPEPELEPEVVEEPVAEEAPEVVETPEVVAEEADTTEEKTEEEVASTPESSSTTTGSSFLDKFAQQDNSVGGRFSAGPLNSLIGAFGLNERLRFINDLFDGSSEKFSDAIKALDAQSGLDDARQKAAGYAEENDWDPEEEVVAEFMNYLNRRYA